MQGASRGQMAVPASGRGAATGGPRVGWVGVVKMLVMALLVAKKREREGKLTTVHGGVLWILRPVRAATDRKAGCGSPRRVQK